MVKFKSQWKDVKAALALGFVLGFLVGMWILGVAR